MHDILKGLAYVHANNVMHRDLKPQNILLHEATNTVRLADFGLSRSCQGPQHDSYTPNVRARALAKTWGVLALSPS